MTTTRLSPERKFERQRAGMRGARELLGRGRASVYYREGSIRHHALIAGLRRAEGGIARRLVHEDRRQFAWRRGVHAVEQSERAVAMLQQTQHGDHTLNGAKQRLRRVHAARRIELPQRQEIQQQLQNRLGVSPDMTAIAQNLGAPVPE